MRLLDRQILTELIGPFGFGVAAFTSLMFAGKELFRITELLAEYGAPLLTAAELMVLHIPSLIVVTLPMAMLLAALLGFGRLSGDSEVVALYSGGISLYRIALPVVAVSLVVTSLSFTLNEVVVPKTNTLHEDIFRTLKSEPLASTKPILAVDAKDGFTNSVLYAQHGFDPATGSMRDVWLIQYWDNKPAIFVYGKEAQWKNDNEWLFRDGYWKSIGQDGEKSVTMSFTESRTVKLNKSPEDLARYQKKYDELSFAELKNHIRMLEREGADVNEFRVRLYQKIALPLASLVFALIGTPLGMRPHRSGSAMGLGLSVVIIFAYYVLMHYMTILGKNGAVSPAAASFIPALAGVVVGIVLISRAAK